MSQGTSGGMNGMNGHEHAAVHVIEHAAIEHEYADDGWHGCFSCNETWHKFEQLRTYSHGILMTISWGIPPITLVLYSLVYLTSDGPFISVNPGMTMMPNPM